MARRAGSCFKELEVTLTLALPPACLRDFYAAVCEHLNQKLMKYVPFGNKNGSHNAGGILLAYWGVELDGDHGHIRYEQPEVHCRVRCHALFFAPSHGLVLVGEVNQVGSDHVGLLVAGAFNASVSRENVPADLVPVSTTATTGGAATSGEDEGDEEDDDDEEDDKKNKKSTYGITESWRSKTDPSVELSSGRYAALQTVGVGTARRIITIFGTMLAPHTGPLRWTPSADGESHELAPDNEDEAAAVKEQPEEQNGAQKKSKKEHSKQKKDAPAKAAEGAATPKKTTTKKPRKSTDGTLPVAEEGAPAKPRTPKKRKAATTSTTTTTKEEGGEAGKAEQDADVKPKTPKKRKVAKEETTTTAKPKTPKKTKKRTEE